MKAPKFEVFQSPRNNQWYWHLKSANGKVIAHGEGHTRKQDAERAIKTVGDTVLTVLSDAIPIHGAGK